MNKNEILIKVEGNESLAVSNSENQQIIENSQIDSDYEDNLSQSKVSEASDNEDTNKSTKKPSKKRKLENKSLDDEQQDAKKPKFNVSNEELDVLRVHTELKCEKCPKMFDDWQDIRSHYRQEHKTIGFVRCCGRKIDRTNEVKDHVSVSLKFIRIFQNSINFLSFPSGT